jgi:hypothetical protein
MSFAGNATGGGVSLRAQDILLRLRAALDDAANFQQWLAAQSDADLAPGETGVGLSPPDIGTLRSAFADVTALGDIANNKQPPSTYPQLPSTYNFLGSARQIIGPA